MDDPRILKRPNFFSGKLLTADDLSQEQEYVLDKFKRHNRTLHGFGIISGLKVSAHAGQITVAPGIALDCEGNELVVDSAQSIVPPEADGNCVRFVNLKFVVRHPSGMFKTDAGESIESVELSLDDENCNRGHRHLRARWIACGQAHALTIAKLKLSSGKWRLERAYRPPTVK